MIIVSRHADGGFMSMVKCPSCGASSIFGFQTKRCVWCGKIVCDRCVPNWHGTLSVKISAEDSAGPAYETLGFCSDNCFYGFWGKVLAHPAEYLIGTNIENFRNNWIMYWNDSILTVLSANADTAIADKARKAVQIHSARFVAFPWFDSSNKSLWMAKQSADNARLALAQNLEKCGRTVDAAKVFEELRMYDKARELREKERHIIIKKTDVSININALLQQIKDNGLVAIYRCPHCGGKLKIDKNASMDKLRVCEHCGSEIETMDLADFLRTALS
jgi:DNA-directed RNA polymerase subunit RPC12/RpoP